MKTLKEFKRDLDEKISDSDQIFIVPHLGCDFDALGSCIALSLICKKLDKPSYIILDEDPIKIEAGVKSIVDLVKNQVQIINYKNATELYSNNDLLITCDVNKTELICCTNDINRFKDIIVIDHHKEDEKTINTNAKYIDTDLSSICELMAEMLSIYQIKYSPDIANILLSGIYLDTNKFAKNVSSKTMKIVSKLLEKGANVSIVNDYFSEDFTSDRKVQDLVSKADFDTFTIATCVSEENTIYTKEELAKVADYLLKYKVDAAFAIGYIAEKLISISARSKGRVDVGKIMEELDGGGNIFSGAAKIENDNITDVSKKLSLIIKPKFFIG